MATISKPFEDENEQDQPAASQPQQIGTPQGGGTVGSSMSAPSKPGTGTSSGSFNNIQKYMNANSGFNQAGGGLAGKVVGNINQQANTTKQNVQGAQSAFNQQASQNVGQFNNPELLKQAFQDPTKFAQDENNVASFAKARDAAYTGPKGFQDLSGQQNLANLQSQTAGVNDLVKQGQSEGGRFNLLKQMFGKTGYSSGQQNLDNLLMQGNKGQLDQLQGSRRIAADATKTLGSGQQAAQQAAEQNANLANQVRTNTRNQLNKSVLDQSTDVDARTAAADAAQKAATEQFKKNLAEGKMSRADATRFGLSDQTNLYNLDLNQFANQAAAAGGVNAQTVANQDDYNKFAALNKLMGGNASVPSAVANSRASQILSSFSDPTQAGKALGGNAYNFDPSQLLNQIAGTKANYDQQSDLFNTNIRQAQESGRQINSKYDSFLSPDNLNRQFRLQDFNSLTDRNNAIQKYTSDVNRNRAQELSGDTAKQQEYTNKMKQLENLINPYKKLQYLD